MKKILLRYVCSWCGKKIKVEEKEMSDDLAHLDTTHDICSSCFDRFYKSSSSSGSSSSSDLSKPSA